MPYQPCRWYDQYPGLSFVLKILRLMPVEAQATVGYRLKQYLAYRVAHPVGLAVVRGNRWYDEVPSLLEGLERLKAAPPHVREQSTDYLMKLVEDVQAPVGQICA